MAVPGLQLCQWAQFARVAGGDGRTWTAALSVGSIRQVLGANGRVGPVGANCPALADTEYGC